MAITLKDTNEQIVLKETELHDAFQYALLPGGIMDLVKVRLIPLLRSDLNEAGELISFLNLVV